MRKQLDQLDFISSICVSTFSDEVFPTGRKERGHQELQFK